MTRRRGVALVGAAWVVLVAAFYYRQLWRVIAGGLGLVSINERVRLLRGTVSIDTRPHGGTRMRVLIPSALITEPAGEQFT